MKTSELTGVALDWAVAKCEGNQDDALTWVHTAYPSRCYDYSSDWAQGGAIIEREEISIAKEGDEPWAAWSKSPFRDEAEAFGYGETPLIAAMRCYVASKLGDEIEVPEELLDSAHG